jgi:fructoselysine-6-P-deglycase FrlB-like protein
MVYRETGKQREAAHQFRRAIALAEETSWMVGEAEAMREMARLNELTGCKAEAVTLLTVAHGLFSHVEAAGGSGRGVPPSDRAGGPPDQLASPVALR